MPRPRIYADGPMTPAERQRRHRERRKIEIQELRGTAHIQPTTFTLESPTDGETFRRQAMDEDEKELLKKIYEHYEDGRFDAPGHHHKVARHWDEDGCYPCEWCATWAKFREFMWNNS
jgi:hypothetical protein